MKQPSFLKTSHFSIISHKLDLEYMNPLDASILRRLYVISSPKGYCWVTADAIAAGYKVRRQTIGKALKRLREQGLIFTEQAQQYNGDFSTKLHFINYLHPLLCPLDQTPNPSYQPSDAEKKEAALDYGLWALKHRDTH